MDLSRFQHIKIAGARLSVSKRYLLSQATLPRSQRRPGGGRTRPAVGSRSRRWRGPAAPQRSTTRKPGCWSGSRATHMKLAARRRRQPGNLPATRAKQGARRAGKGPAETGQALGVEPGRLGFIETLKCLLDETSQTPKPYTLNSTVSGCLGCSSVLRRWLVTAGSPSSRWQGCRGLGPAVRGRQMAGGVLRRRRVPFSAPPEVRHGA